MRDVSSADFGPAPSLNHGSDPTPRRNSFTTTHWSVVLNAGSAESTAASEALGQLYSQYAYPIYGYLRRRGFVHDDALDILHAFFERLLEHGVLSGIDRNRGKFRAFLLTVLGNFVNDEWDRRKTQKRGGNQTFIPLSHADLENAYSGELEPTLSPDQLFERRWISALLAGVLNRLEEECRAEGSDDFGLLKAYLVGDSGAPPYGVTAAQLGQSDGAIRVRVHRLRKRYIALFRDEVLKTVASPRDLREEVRALLAAFAD